VVIGIKNISSRVLEAKYAVRGPIVRRAQELQKHGREIVWCNIGNPQALKQKPLTYIRQTLSLVEYPDLLNDRHVDEIFPRDVIERARFITTHSKHGLGAYTVSPGFEFVRDAVSRFIAKRDGITASAEDIYLTDGASQGVQFVLSMLIANPNDGIMIPVPQYPLYSALISLLGGRQVNYFLDEGSDWQLSHAALEQSIKDAKERGVNIKALVVINPGNPTGAVLDHENIKMIIEFAREHGLSIIADEVYQENVYSDEKRFISFARVMHELGIEDVSLFSLHSASKGYLGECGHRAGYLEVRNIPSDVQDELLKLRSIGLCSNAVGQIITYLMVSPPEKGDESYELFTKERSGILSSLKRKAHMLSKGLNSIDGIECRTPSGAMYVFPKIDLPSGKTDSDYCSALLEATGICVVPGSGFGQLPGTWHFRATFLPPEGQIEHVVEKIGEFHQDYINA